MRLLSLILIIVGWVIVLIGALGSGVTFHIGALDPLLTGVVLILAGLTLRGAARSLLPF